MKVAFIVLVALFSLTACSTPIENTKNIQWKDFGTLVEQKHTQANWNSNGFESIITTKGEWRSYTSFLNPAEVGSRIYISDDGQYLKSEYEVISCGCQKSSL